MSLAHPILQTIIVVILTFMWRGITYDSDLFQVAIHGTIAYWLGYVICRVRLFLQGELPFPSDEAYANFGYLILQVMNYYISLYIVNLKDARLDSFF